MKTDEEYAKEILQKRDKIIHKRKTIKTVTALSLTITFFVLGAIFISTKIIRPNSTLNTDTTKSTTQSPNTAESELTNDKIMYLENTLTTVKNNNLNNIVEAIYLEYDPQSNVFPNDFYIPIYNDRSICISLLHVHTEDYIINSYDNIIDLSWINQIDNSCIFYKINNQLICESSKGILNSKDIKTDSDIDSNFIKLNYDEKKEIINELLK